MSLYGDIPPPTANQSSDSSGALYGSNTGINNSSKESISTPSDSSATQNPTPRPVVKSVTAPHFLPTAIRRPQPSSSKFTSFRKPPVFKPTITAETPIAAPQPIVQYAPPSRPVPPIPEQTPASKPVDEYDPTCPNNFFEMQQLRNESRKAAITEFFQSRNKRSRSSSQSSSRSSSRSPRRETGRYAAIPPPAALNAPLPETEIETDTLAPKAAPFASSGEEAYLRRLQMSHKATNSAAPVPQASVQPEVSSHSGTILLLINMVGRGDVDSSLEDEVKQECAKFGPVKKVLIYEVPPPFPDSQAVRIFVEFEASSSAERAKSALHGRFFGGRAIQTSFFDPIRFHRRDLAPTTD